VAGLCLLPLLFWSIASSQPLPLASHLSPFLRSIVGQLIASWPPSLAILQVTDTINFASRLSFLSSDQSKKWSIASGWPLPHLLVHCKRLASHLSPFVKEHCWPIDCFLATFSCHLAIDKSITQLILPLASLFLASDWSKKWSIASGLPLPLASHLLVQCKWLAFASCLSSLSFFKEHCWLIHCFLATFSCHFAID